jgi:hypothetical protein
MKDAQLSGNSMVSAFVPLDFLCPIVLTGIRQTTVFPTTMPKTTVNEERDSLDGKDEVGFPRKIEVAAPTFHACFSKDPD